MQLVCSQMGKSPCLIVFCTNGGCARRRKRRERRRVACLFAASVSPAGLVGQSGHGDRTRKNESVRCDFPETLLEEGCSVRNGAEDTHRMQTSDSAGHARGEHAMTESIGLWSLHVTHFHPPTFRFHLLQRLCWTPTSNVTPRNPTPWKVTTPRKFTHHLCRPRTTITAKTPKVLEEYGR